MIVLAELPKEVLAADIRLLISGSGSYRVIVIEGDIKPGDFDTFISIAKENQGKVSGVYLFTPGGDFYEAMKIGRAMRALELSSQVPMRDSTGRAACEDSFATPKDPKNCTCASAGFFIHIGGVHRGGTYLAVHRPYFGKGKFGELSQADAKREFDALQQSARTYMEEMGVPNHIQEDVLGTPSDKALLLDDKTVKTYFWLELPYRHEWIINKCSPFSVDERKRFNNYLNRPSGSLTTAESDDFGALLKKDSEERKCAIKINEQSRFEAYTKYFGEKPTDYKNHDFSKWAHASKYIGKRFYDLLSEEKFEAENQEIINLHSLKRNATASAPSISLSDSLLSEPHVVSSVILVSAPNPSKDFIRLVVSTLEESWGNSKINENSDKWYWSNDKYTAELKYETGFASGPSLVLVIDEKK